MLNRKVLNQGVGVAVGLFLASAVILPLVSDRSFGEGLSRGFGLAGIALVIYIVIAVVKKERREE